MNSLYGTKETGGLSDARGYHAERHRQASIDLVDWSTPGLRITRLRLLSDPGFPVYDVSYCHGVLDGQHVEVELPFSQIPKRGLSKFIVAHAKRDGVFARGVGILDAISTLC